MAAMYTETALEALQRACWHCSHYGGIAPGGNSARCWHGGRLSTCAPINGCTHFSREPGADDRLALPDGFSLGGLSPVWRDAVLLVLAGEAGP